MSRSYRFRHDDRRVIYGRRSARPTACTICHLPAAIRALIELALHEGASLSWIAPRFGVTRMQVRHHHANCRAADDAY